MLDFPYTSLLDEQKDDDDVYQFNDIQIHEQSSQVIYLKLASKLTLWMAYRTVDLHSIIPMHQTLVDAALLSQHK